MGFEEDIILIAGPTASGKTRAAIDIAVQQDALILNADSMQVYSELNIVSARPSQQEIEQAPHHLFGHVKGDADYSVSHWLRDVKPFLARGQKLVIVGGTGLYFNSLLEGLSPIPEIDLAIREKWRQAGDVPTEELHGLLDPLAASELRVTDRQRVIRALEVYESTGRSIVEWQEMKGVSVLPQDTSVKKILLMPERAILHERINQRFDLMVEAGALEEVRALLALNYPPHLPVMKAIGVPHLARHLLGEETIDESIEKAKAATRQYAKRQSTWFRNSFDENWERLGS